MTTAQNAETELPSNWGRWGDHDERGTLNFITDTVRMRAVETATNGRVVSLAMPVQPAPLAGPIPFGSAPSPAGLMQILNFTGSPARAMTDVLIVNTHHSSLTHIDALVHVPVGTRVYPGIEIADAVRGSVLHASTAPFAQGIITRGVLLDLAPDSRVEPGREIAAADLDAAEKRAGVRVESGDALIVRGGWNVTEGATQPVPFIGLGAVTWMRDREVSLFAGDISDPPPFAPGTMLMMHQVALARLGMPLIDGVNVTELVAVSAELTRSTFLFVVSPMAVLGATGVPVNPLAIF